MQLKEGILNQFISPDNDNKALVQESINDLTAQILEFLCEAGSKPTLPDPSALDKKYFQIPDSAQIRSTFTNYVNDILEGSMNAASPKNIGHMDSMPTLWSVLGDYLASAINNNMLSLEMSPFLTQLEYSLTKQFAEIFGLPGSAGGLLLSGGTLSNLQALVIARNEILKIKGGNCFSLVKEPVLFTSELAHASIEKIGMLMGIGRENVIKIKADLNSKMDIQDLEYQIQTNVQSGKQPFAIVATAGTTVSGNIDPLPGISAIAKKYNLWLHVDAIYGGAVIFSEKHRGLIKGIELADSISFNPQKWLLIAKTCSMVLFKDFGNMVENFRVEAPYMKDQNQFINLGEISLHGTRHAEAVKLWLSLLSLGKEGYKDLIEYNFFIAELFHKEILKREYLELSAPPELNIFCFRGAPDYLDEKKYDQWNECLQDFLLKKGGFFLSLPRYQNKLWLRAVLLNPFLKPGHIAELFSEMDKFEEKERARV